MKWEYKAVNIYCIFKTGNGIANKIQDTCNGYGKMGWELFTCQSYDMGRKFILVFKKLKNE